MKIPEDKRKTGAELVRKKLIAMRRTLCKDFLKFREYYFKRYHTFPDADFHRELSGMLSEMTIEKGLRYAIAAPRESAKSTIVSLEYVVYCICYKLEGFIVIISSNSDQASDFLSHVKDELRYNLRLIEDFPEVCEIGESPKPPRWTQKEIITRNGVKVLALGTDQQIRGRRNRDARPSLIILDDIETSDSIQNPESFQKLENWLTKSVLKSGTDKTNIFYIGTIHHYNSLLAKFTSDNDYPGWNKKVYRSIISWAENTKLWQQWTAVFSRKEFYEGEDGRKGALHLFKDNEEAMLKGAVVLWPAKKDYYSLMVTREEDGYYSFDSEMQNEPVNPRDCCFNPEHNHYWDDKFDSEKELLDFLSARNGYVMLGGCDPSMGKEGMRGDRSAILTVVKDIQDGTLYVLDVDASKRHPDKIIEDIVTYHKYRHYNFFAFETIQAQEYIANQLTDYAINAGFPLNVREIKPHTDKLARIQSLQPLVKRGHILFLRKHQILLEEMRFFPRGRYDDTLDALWMVYEVSLTITGGCFSHPANFQQNNVKSDVLDDTPDIRSKFYPRVDRRKSNDRFVPPGDAPRFYFF